MKPRTLPVVGIALLCLMLWGCGGGSGSSGDTAQLRVIHAMPQMSLVDVVLDGSSTLFFSALQYQSTTGYQQVSVASHTVALEEMGTSNIFLSATFNAAAKGHYTIVASGFSGGPSNLGTLVVSDDLAAPASGNFKIRTVNASPSSGTEDVYITSPGADLTTLTPNFANLAFLTATDYLSLPAGNYEVRMTPAGSKSVDIDSGTLSFSSGQIRSVLVEDAPGGGSPGEIGYSDVN